MNDDLGRSLTLVRRLASINRTIAGSVDFEEALGLIAGSGVEFVGADSCLVLLREGEDNLRICAARGIEPATAARFVGAMEESVLAKLRQFLGFPGSRNIAASPIVSDRSIKGILVVIGDAPLNAEEAFLLTALADQAAVTLENAHLLHEAESREARLQDEVMRSGTLAQELESLIHSIAERLKAPLKTMTGCGDQLLSEGGGRVLTDKGREALVRMGADARRMDEMVRDLLAYCRLAGEEISLEPVDLEGAVLEALSALKSEIESRGTIVRVKPPLFGALAHRGTLVRMLGKMLSNALKVASPDGPPLVEVKAELRGEFVRVSLLGRATGFGKTRPDQAAGDAGRPGPAEQVAGTEIGLAIVQRGAERMGGRCGMESTPGRDGPFWIELRRA